jgi:hypothetical protein
MKIKECKAIVKHILETNPHTRNSDNDLIVEVLNFIEPGVTHEPFEVVIKQCHINGRFPTLETIRRTRQKIQEHYPELAPTEEVEGLRVFQEHKFFDFAITRKV